MASILAISCVQRDFRVVVTLAIAWPTCYVPSSSAHDLPISHMMLVADEDTMHVELVLHADELSFFSEVDSNKNGFLERSELRAQGKEIARKLVESFSIRIDGKPVMAAVYGIVPDLGSHHLTVRAHYPGDAREAPVHLKSRLAAITRRTHVINVTFRSLDFRQMARLDAHDDSVLFHQAHEQITSTPIAEESSTFDEGRTYRAQIALFAGLAVVLGCLFFLTSKK